MASVSVMSLNFVEEEEEEGSPRAEKACMAVLCTSRGQCTMVCTTTYTTMTPPPP